MKKNYFILLLALLISSSVMADQVAYKDIDGKWHIEKDGGVKQYKPGTKGVEVIKGANITFNVTYLDEVNNTNVGFDDPTNGTARKTIIANVLTYIDGIIDATGSCDVQINESQTDGTGSLGFAGTYYFSSPNGLTNGFAFSHITTGSDPHVSYPDIHCTIDFGFSWNSTMNDPTGSQVDLYSVILHEFTHGLGLLSLLNSDGTSGITSSNPGVFSKWDDLLTTGNGKDLVNSSGSFLGTASDLLGSDGGLKFTGANTTTSYGSNPPIYAPSSWEDGSSISHWNTNTILNSPVMTHAIAYGVKKRIYAAFEMQTFKDIGYTLEGSDVKEWSLY